MCQGACLKLIEKYPGIVTTEIIRRTGLNKSSINTSLRKLYDHGDVERRKILLENGWQYAYWSNHE